MEPKQISVSEFTNDVNNGMNVSQISEKHNISKMAVKKIAKQLNLKMKRTIKPKFELVYDNGPIIHSHNIATLETING